MCQISWKRSQGYGTPEDRGKGGGFSHCAIIVLEMVVRYVKYRKVRNHRNGSKGMILEVKEETSP